MERSFGVEIISAFGARLRGLYGQDEQGLPAPMRESLERLKRAEDVARKAHQASQCEETDHLAMQSAPATR